MHLRLNIALENIMFQKRDEETIRDNWCW